MFRMLLRYTGLRMPFYAVRRGRKAGVYATWSECESQVKGFTGARYKKFPTEEEAWSFVNETDVKVSSAKQPTATDDGKTKSSNKTAASPTQSSTPATSSSEVKEASGEVKEESSEVKDAKSRKRSAILLSFDEIAPKKSASGEITGPAAVFTDGCCFNNGKGNPQAGVGVYWGPDHPNNLSERLPGRQTNNRAEIYAALRALQQAKAEGYQEITIHTDSQFLINCTTKWTKKWMTNGWKSSNGSEVINREELELLVAEEAGIKVNYVYVKGHDGIDGNEQADKLANLGARKELPSS